MSCAQENICVCLCVCIRSGLFSNTWKIHLDPTIKNIDLLWSVLQFVAFKVRKGDRCRDWQRMNWKRKNKLTEAEKDIHRDRKAKMEWWIWVLPHQHGWYLSFIVSFSTAVIWVKVIGTWVRGRWGDRGLGDRWKKEIVRERLSPLILQYKWRVWIRAITKPHTQLYTNICLNTHSRQICSWTPEGCWPLRRNINCKHKHSIYEPSIVTCFISPPHTHLLNYVFVLFLTLFIWSQCLFFSVAVTLCVLLN